MSIGDLVNKLFRNKPEPVGFTIKQLEQSGYKPYPQNKDWYVKYDSDDKIIEGDYYIVVDSHAKNKLYKKIGD